MCVCVCEGESSEGDSLITGCKFLSSFVFKWKPGVPTLLCLIEAY